MSLAALMGLAHTAQVCGVLSGLVPEKKDLWPSPADPVVLLTGKARGPRSIALVSPASSLVAHLPVHGENFTENRQKLYDLGSESSQTYMAPVGILIL